jgi:hypothetical protein
MDLYIETQQAFNAVTRDLNVSIAVPVRLLSAGNKPVSSCV